jgi:DNA-binding XRE family transcriptional regulator
MPRPVDPSRANKLRALRQAQNLPLWGLAVRVGTSTSMLSAIECWNYKPRPALCQRIATALGVKVSDIWPEAKV